MQKYDVYHDGKLVFVIVANGLKGAIKQATNEMHRVLNFSPLAVVLSTTESSEVETGPNKAVITVRFPFDEFGEYILMEKVLD